MYFVISLSILVALLILMHFSKAKCLLTIMIMQPTFDLFRLVGGVTGWMICVCLMMLFLLREKNSHKKHFPFKISFCFLFVSYFISYSFGEYNQPSAFMPYLGNAFLIFLLWKYYIPSMSNIKFILVVGGIYYLVLAIYGIYEGVSFTRPFTDWYYKVSNSIRDDDIGERFGLNRAYSLTMYITYFANACGIGLIFLTHVMLYQKNVYIPRFLTISYIFVMIGGILVSADRSAMLMTTIFMTSLIPFALNQKKWIFLALFVSICVYYKYSEYFDEIYYALTHVDDVSGSNLSMRGSQLKAAAREFNTSPIWGHGLSAIGKIKEHSNLDLLGGESYMFELLVNYGILGIWAYIYLNVSSLIYLIKKHAFKIIPVLVGFIVYNLMALPVNILYIFPFIIVLLRNEDLTETRFVRMLNDRR